MNSLNKKSSVLTKYKSDFYFSGNETCFYIAWFLFVSTLILGSAIFCATNRYLEIFLKLIRYLAYMMFGVKICIGGFKRNSIVLLLLISVTFVIAGVSSKDTTFPLYSLIVLASIGIDNKRLVRFTTFLQGTYLAGIVLLSQCGLILDYIFDADTRARHGLGFNWTTIGPYLYFFFCLNAIYLLREKLTLKLIIVLELINFWFFRMTDSKMAFLLLSMVFLFFLFESTNENRWNLLCRFDWIYIMFPFIMLGLTIFIVKIYDDYDPIWIIVNRVLSGRLIFSQDAYKTYGIHLLGQNIQWVGYSYKALFETAREYNYVDSSYLQISLNNGLIFMSVVLLIYSYGIWKAAKQNDYYLVMLYITVLVLCMMEPWLMNFAYNPFPLIALGEISKTFSYDMSR